MNEAVNRWLIFAREDLRVAETCFQRPRDSESTRLKRQVAQLEAKLAKKDEVLGEVMEEQGLYVA